ncbi:MAG: protein TolQ [Sandaracinaceae bacterium]|nr:protein TolQ [Sandaracinaceae bacterium]MCC6877903.1 protein TolQ [Sandaracinaceae bacterium]
MLHFVLLQAAPASLDPWDLILQAGIVVKLVMLVLLLMSLGCWFISGAKLVRVLQARSQSVRFLDLFWREGQGGWTTERLEAIYAQIKGVSGSPLAKVFHAGYVELARMQGAEQTLSGPAEPQLDNVERALRRASVAEMTRLEAMLPFLATTGSTGPFIGLFGTVWGIMSSFMSIGAQHDASLDVVAPGIAEALIATAIGLVAAIPAVMAYNFFVRRIRVLESEVDAFSSDYLNIVKRHFL